MKVQFAIVIVILLGTGTIAKGQASATDVEYVKQFFQSVRAYQSIDPVRSDSSSRDSNATETQVKSDTAFINFLCRDYILAIPEITKREKCSDEKENRVRKEINLLYLFLNKYAPEQLTIRPLAVGKEGPYAELNRFQQKNSIAVLHDKKPLMYLLIVPHGTIKNINARILSWQLVYTLGRYEFQDILGNRGIELLL